MHYKVVQHSLDPTTQGRGDPLKCIEDDEQLVKKGKEIGAENGEGGSEGGRVRGMKYDPGT